MREVVEDIERWTEEGNDIALATVVATWGSGPRGPGSKMAFTAEGKLAGSVSGGCVEAAVVEEGQEVLRTGEPKLLKYGVADETAWSVGLSCGGTIEIFVERLDEALFRQIGDALATRAAVATATVVGAEHGLGSHIVVDEGGAVAGEMGSDAVEAAEQALREGRSTRLQLEDGRDVFIDVVLPSPTLIMVGGVHISIALSAVAHTLGFRAIVVDPRGVFGSKERFAHADALLDDWPDEALEKIGVDRSTAVATLTHDPKLDDPALGVALRSPAFFVGALGSRKTHQKRVRRLKEQGLTDTELDKLHAPIGLPIGSRTPEEIALAIMAQVVAARNGALS